MSDPQQCLPVGNNFCVFCRFPIWAGEIVAAVGGDWSASKLTAFTFGFPYPPIDRGNEDPSFVLVYDKGQLLVARTCRYPPCSTHHIADEVILYHVDCHQFLSRERRFNLQSIWLMGLWTRSLPKPQYHEWSCDSVDFLDSIYPGPDPFISGFAKLPRELRLMIARHCKHARFWRLFKARYRRRFFQSLLLEHHPVNVYRLSEVISWNRESGVTLGRVESGRVRLRLDGYGASQLDLLASDHVDERPPKENWFAIEKVTELEDAWVLIKGRCLRIMTSSVMHVWDAPLAPNGSFKWNKHWWIPSQARSIPLQGLTGLTAFCREGACYWVVPHYKDTRYEDALPPSQDHLHPREREDFTPIYYPLAEHEYIDSMCIRFLHTSKGQLNHTLILRTNYERVMTFGDYVHSSRLGITLKGLSNSKPSHLILPHHDLSIPDTNFAAIRVNTRTTGVESITVPWGWVSHFPSPNYPGSLYLTSAAVTRDLCRVQAFYRPRPKPRWLDDRQCIGALFFYSNGAVESMGSCYGRSTSELIEPTEILVRYPYHGGIDIIFSALPPNVRAGLFDDVNVFSLDQEMELFWWFTDDGPLDLMRS